MKNILRQFLEKIVKGKISKDLGRRLKELKFPDSNLEDKNYTHIGVLQLKYQSAEGVKFADLIYSIVSKAHYKHVGTLFFPGGLQYVFFPPFKENVKYVKFFTENYADDFIKVFSKMAMGFGMNIFTGEFYIYENDEILRCGVMLDATGKISYIYKKSKERLEILEPLKIERLKFSFLSVEECLMYEFSKLSVMKGANVLVNCSIGNVSPYKSYEFKGIWSRCQQFKVFGINATFVGETPWGYSNLPSGLYGPIEFFDKGIVATAMNFSETEVINGEFDLGRVGLTTLQQNNLNKLVRTLKL